MILNDNSGQHINLEQSDKLTYKKVFNSGKINIARDCSETGLYKLNGVTMEDPFGPYVDSPTNAVWCLVRTMCLNDQFKYQEVIWDAGKFFRGTYQGNDHYLPWMAEVWNQYRIEDLEKRISALEKQIGGVLTRLYTKLRGTFTSLEVA
ncbi:hypothetical protein [Lactobacillus crispatus]|uniref:hypothetical protein n=1 Tax=Lactobacillus crispatus TaxID=47770 RepID=UPI0018E3C35A|nr:hypothetical protein [Lactobacillus crispatus]MBI1718015.1 hypothetical protein [Lactobacillus crispatus]